MNDIQITEFDIFHEKNPWVYNYLVTRIRQWFHDRPNRDNVGLDDFYAPMRDNAPGFIESVRYRLPNEHRAYYARLIMHQEPDLAGKIRIRASAADEWLANRRSA